MELCSYFQELHGQPPEVVAGFRLGAPKVSCEHLCKQKHASSDMSGMHKKVINLFANSGEASYQTKHQAWVTKHSDSGDSNSTILYLYSAVEWVKELHSTSQWKNKKIPSCLHPPSKKRFH